MGKSVKKFYWTMLLALFVISAYPIGMSIKTIVLHLQNRSIQLDDYAQYIIPYTAVCASILIIILLYPLLSKLRRYSVLAASILGLGLFAGMEWYMEGITIHTPEAHSVFQWHIAQGCTLTEGMQIFQKLYDNSFRIQYMLVSFLLILLVIGTVYRYENAISTKDRKKRNILLMQFLFTGLFVVFYIAITICSFFQETIAYLVPYSSFMTGLFFVLIGIAFGTYLAGFLVGKSRMVSTLLPAVGALLMTFAMYYGEYKMLDGILYRFGYIKFFQALPFTVITWVDIFIIMISTILTAVLVDGIGRFSEKQENQHQAKIQNNNSA